MSDRFYFPAGFASDQVTLEGAEAKHLSQVLRAKVGQSIQLFDGLGRAASAEIVAIHKREVALRIVLRAEDLDESSREFVLATAVPKGERFRWLIEKATELGVSQIVPLDTARSVVEPGEGKLTKARQAVVEACKQSGRNRLMEISDTQPLASFLRERDAADSLVMAHPTGGPIREYVARSGDAKRVTALVGPEGGFIDEEVALAVGAGATLVNLGPRILRVETAGVMLASLFAG